MKRLAQRPSPVWQVALVVACLAGVGPATPLAAEVLEVHELSARLADYGRGRLTIVGRFRSAAAGTIRLVDSALVCRLAPTARLPRPAPPHLELSGHFEPEGSEWVFLVEHAGRAPSEAQEFAARRGRIAADNPGSLYALATWARRRANWYRDAELEGLGVAAAREGLDAQIRPAHVRRDAARLLWLAQWAEWGGWEPEAIQSLRHEALALALARSEPPTPVAWRREARRVRRWLPGTDGAWPPEQAFDQASYLADPLTAYGQLPRELRPRAHRLLWSECVEREILAEAAQPRADLLELAARAERDLPDRPELPRDLRLREARGWAARPQELTRGRLLEIAARLTEAGQAAEAEAAIQDWLAAERRRLTARDALGRMRLAEDYRALAHDDATAGRLALEAWDLSPELARAAKLLAELGYQRLGSRWQRPEQLTPSQLQAVRSGRAASAVTVGASEQTVVERLRRPDRVARTVTGRQITEQWIYEGPPRLDLYLRRPPGGGSATVFAIGGAGP